MLEPQEISSLVEEMWWMLVAEQSLDVRWTAVEPV
jgi:hypothetical protein